MVAIKSLLAIALAVVPAFSQYISNIQVYYGTKPNQQPPNAVKEVTGQSDDINFQFGGDYVWLVPVKTSDRGAAATGWDLDITSKAIPWAQDLAAGAGGDYRYIFASYGGGTPVTELGLYRTGSGISTPPPGYDAMTGDINKGRGKTYLYLVWKIAKTEDAAIKAAVSAAESSQKYISDTVKI
ncbi:hypothetical protein EXIGLDRAFT_760985 [Exidia glandulosa HHB12029]|uniref:Uncharacterized protein n=1 Tax=Exidia glandulosa HHB12029 TaxID=1314781 RepID=A0A165NU67_EXIGL|nr:hypothetical protein EXIGLDRAFT_760985 [Exidia glandulosa HHB12029]